MCAWWCSDHMPHVVLVATRAAAVPQTAVDVLALAPRLQTPRRHLQLWELPGHVLLALLALLAHGFQRHSSPLGPGSLPVQTLAPMPSQGLTAAQGPAQGSEQKPAQRPAQRAEQRPQLWLQQELLH